MLTLKKVKELVEAPVHTKCVPSPKVLLEDRAENKIRRYEDKPAYSREQLISAIENYIDYYNNRRYQHRLFIQTPMQAHVSAMNRVA